MRSMIRNITLMIGMVAIMTGLTLGQVPDAFAQGVGPDPLYCGCAADTKGMARMVLRGTCDTIAETNLYRSGVLRPPNANDNPEGVASPADVLNFYPGSILDATSFGSLDEQPECEKIVVNNALIFSADCSIGLDITGLPMLCLGVPGGGLGLLRCDDSRLQLCDSGTF